MGVSVHIMREQNHLFPKFSLQVLSPLEAMFSILSKKKREGEEEPDNSGGSDSGSTANSLAVLASMLAFLANSDEDRDEVARTDQLVCRALQDVSPARLSDWHLGPLLSGELSWENNVAREMVWFEAGAGGSICSDKLSPSSNQNSALYRGPCLPVCQPCCRTCLTFFCEVMLLGIILEHILRSYDGGRLSAITYDFYDCFLFVF